MIIKKSIHVAAMTAAAALVTSTAHAQYVRYAQPAPLYPYVVQQPQYAYPQPQYAPQPYPYVQSGPNMRRVSRHYAKPHASVPSRKVSRTRPSLVEELRSKGRKKKAEKDTGVVNDKDVAIDKKIVVREKPIVRKHIRVVDNPPIVVQREIDENGQVLSEQRVSPVQAQIPAQVPARAPAPIGAARVIHAEAEVTILGPDRMSIRLYRKGDGRDANAKAPPGRSKKTGKIEKSQPET